VPAGTLTATPDLPAELGEVRLRGARLWHRAFDLRAERRAIDIDDTELHTIVPPA
jgi:hypothetical protein